MDKWVAPPSYSYYFFLPEEPFSCPFLLSPGREPVRHWLDILDRKLDRVEGSLDHADYNNMIEWNSEDA